jgi:hypothetical protein
MANLTPPVPSDGTSMTINLADHGGEELAIRLIFDAGYKQAIPEREELAALLMELGQEVEEEADALCSGENIHPETESHAENLRELRDRARAAAERLRGGGEW